MKREEMQARLARRTTPWDLAVVGGGATGLGVAVDAASRGYAVALFEGVDFGKGTSSRSTKLVHGGVRYLRQGNIPLVMEALRERGILRRNAPHLVHDLPFVVPNYDWWEARLDRVLPGGIFGENLTTLGVDVNGAVIGETWLIGDSPYDFAAAEATSEAAPAPEAAAAAKTALDIAPVEEDTRAVPLFGYRIQGPERERRDDVGDRLQTGQIEWRGRVRLVDEVTDVLRERIYAGVYGPGVALRQEQLAAERERQLRELEAQFARDVADPVGGPETENRLVDTISGESMASTGLRPSNVDIACKKASCRIVGSFDRMGDAQDWGLFYITAAGGDVLSSTRMVFVNNAGHQVRAVSPDGRLVGLSRIHDNANTDAYIYDAASGELRQLTPAAGARARVRVGPFRCQARCQWAWSCNCNPSAAISPGSPARSACSRGRSSR